MVAGISKRQQLRNERALQDLIRSVPGNDRCADCSARNPGWASWNLGVFLCVRCAALHRKMGTHISKVKSLSMDTWSAEQVDNMKSHGNTIINKMYNPRNVQPPVPTDIDEADACMERFIRQKYQTRTLEDGKPKPPSRSDSSYTRSPEGSPPPLPPKPSRPFGFGLRSASSATNLKAHSTKHESPGSDGRRSSFEAKLATLRDMGFTNERRNATALRGLDGNLNLTIETLERLGEGNRSGSQLRPPAAVTQRPSSNPFDALDAKQPSQPNGQAYNPFDMSTQQPQPLPQPQSASTQPLEVSFQNLQVTQPLFPHSTGGYPNTQTFLAQPAYQQPAAAPSTSTQGGYVSSPRPLEGGNNPFFQTGAQPQASLSTPTPPQNPPFTQANPYFNQTLTRAPTMPLQSQSTAVAGAPGAALSPPSRQNTMPHLSASPFGQHSPFQQQQQVQLGLQSTQPGQGSFNPFQSMTAPTTPLGYPAQSPFGYPASAQPLVPQPTGLVDKNSILALYNVSAPPGPVPEQQQARHFTGGAIAVPGPGVPSGSVQNPQPSTVSTTAVNSTQQQFSPSPQSTGSRNPFIGVQAGPGAQQPPNQFAAQPSGFSMPMYPASSGASSGLTRAHMSQQSVDINTFQNGRHSPDAFANLSARHGQ